MKRQFFFATVLLVAMVANSCVQEDFSDSALNKIRSSVKFELSSSDMSKVAVSDAGVVTWVPGDAIMIWDGTSMNEIVLTENDITNEGKHASVSVTVDPSAVNFVAVYPASAVESFTAEGVVLNYPEQANGINGQLIAVATCTTESKKFSFSTFTSMVRFSTSNASATFAEFEGASEDVLAAKTTVSNSAVSVYEVSNENEAKKVSIMLAGAGTYYFGLLPNVQLNGFKLSLYDSANTLIGTVSSANTISIAQGTILDLGNVDGLMSLSSGNVIFYESFNQCVGIGGNDDVWDRSSGTVKFDNEGWTATSSACVAAGDRCIRVGMSSENTDLMTPALGITSYIVTVKFKLAAFATAQDRATTLQISVIGEGTLSADNFTKGNGTWLEYTVSLQGANSDTKLKLVPSNYNKGRYFLDEFIVYDGGHSYSYMVDANSPKLIVGTPALLNGLNWTISSMGSVSTESKPSQYNGYCYYPLASNSERGDSEIILSGCPHEIKSVVVNAKTNDKKEVTVSVYVKNPQTDELTLVGKSALLYSKISGYDLKFESATPVSGDLVIRFSSASGGYAIGGVTIN